MAEEGLTKLFTGYGGESQVILIIGALCIGGCRNQFQNDYVAVLVFRVYGRRQPGRAAPNDAYIEKMSCHFSPPSIYLSLTKVFEKSPLTSYKKHFQ
jgi:hypothetical protein